MRADSRVRLNLERLEDRSVPAVVNWTLGASGDFTNANAWSVAGTSPVQHRVPLSTDDAVVPSAFVVTSSASQTVNSVQASNFRITGGTFTFNAVATSSLLPNLTLDSGATLSVAGGNQPVTINGGTLAGTLSTGTGGVLAFAGANTTTLATGASYSGPGLLSIVDGTLQVNTPVSIANYSQAGGVLSGSAAVTISGTATWTAGSMREAGTTTLAAGATLTISGVLTKQLQTQRTLEVFGTVNHTAGNFDFLTSGALVIRPGATYNLAVDANLGGGSGFVTNQGLLVKTSPGAGTSVVSGTFNNSGTLRVDSGTLTRISGTDTGSTTVAAGGTVKFQTGTTSMEAGASFAGSGLVSIADGTLQINTPVSVNNFSQSTGIVSGTGALTLTGAAAWNGGIMQDGGTTTIAAGATLSLSGSLGKTLRTQRTLEILGTANHSAGALSFATAGAIVVRPSGAYNLSAAVTLGSGGTITNQGQFIKSSAGTSTISAAFTTSGTLRVNAGTLAFAPGYTQTASSTFVATGARIQGNVTLTGGTLTGGGAITGKVTSTGPISPGSSPGLLAIDGDVSFVGFVVELFGTTVGTTYDQLQVTGTVTLSGALDLSSPLTPPVGTQFVIIDNDGTDPIDGTFASLPQGATRVASGTTYQISYTGGSGNDVVLTTTASAAPRVMDVRINDGSAQRSMVTSLTVTFSTVVAISGQVGSLFSLQRQNGGLVNFTATATTADGVTTVVLDQFTGAETTAAISATGFGSLVDGRYTLTVQAAPVTANGRNLDGNGDLAGGDNYALADSGQAGGLYRLFGDGNGDRVVNGADLTPFILSFGGTDSTFDVNGDGVVNGTDLTEFVKHFGQGV